MFKKDVLPFTNRRVPTVHDDGVLHPNYLVGLLPPLMHVDQSRAVEGVRPLYRGDIYDEKVTPLAERWERETSDATHPYLNKIRASRKAFPSLSYLASWMEVTTTVRRCQYLEFRDEERSKRAHRTKVCQVDFVDGVQTQTPLNDINTLSEALSSKYKELDASDTRVYVVEDLSRDVIEQFGQKFDVDPHFWREHVDDYLWSGVAPEAMELRSLNVLTRKSPYFSLQYLRPRYYRDTASFVDAVKDASKFNVLRQLDSDRSRDSSQGPNGDAATLMRAKMSLWIRPNKSTEKGVLAILLVDPTPAHGSRIWGGYTSFENYSAQAPPPEPPRTSLYNDALFWMDRMSPTDIASIADDSKACALPAFWHLLSDWHLVIQYVTAQLGQIEWELEIPKMRTANGIEDTMQKLHPWRRNVALYRAMVAASINRIFSLEMQKEYEVMLPNPDCGLPALLRDFQIVLRDIDSIKTRIEGIVSITAAMLSIEEGRRAMDQNRDVAKLTYLATVFIPMSFVCGFLSMVPDIRELKHTFWIFFVIAIPLTALAMVVANLHHLRRIIPKFLKNWGKKTA